jgi:hypothetical protein
MAIYIKKLEEFPVLSLGTRHSRTLDQGKQKPHGYQVHGANF